MEIAVKVDNITYSYPTSREPVLKNISFEVEKGEVFAIVGNNGHGKTTICNLIRGFIPHIYNGELNGSVYIFSDDVKKIPEEVLVRKVGYVFQNPCTQLSHTKRTVFEEVAFGLENLGVPEAEIIKRVRNVIEKLNIGSIQWKNPHELSGGQMQKVAFASVLVMDPDIFIVDEPTSQMDPKSTDEIFEIIYNLKSQKKTTILVEHKMNLVSEYADHVVCIHNGEVLALGSPVEVFQNRELFEKEIEIPAFIKAASILREKGFRFDKYPSSEEEILKSLSIVEKEGAMYDDYSC